MAKFILVYTHPSEGERRFELDSGRGYRIGSRPDNDIVIDQKDVSRRHAVLRVEEGRFHITDLDSKNGTFVNGAKVAAESFGCGDMVHLSSARLVIIEVGSGSYPPGLEAAIGNDDEDGAPREETEKYRSEASMEDIVSLLERTAGAVERGDLGAPLRWAVDHLGFEGGVVTYRDAHDNVAMVASAGELGQLTRRGGKLSRLVVDTGPARPAGTRVRQVTEHGERLLVATVGEQHALVLRYSGRPPAVSDLRSVIAAVGAVLASGRSGDRKGGTTGSASSTGTGRGSATTRIAGLSEAIRRCRAAVVEAAPSGDPVVIVGERGAGCSLAASCVRELSDRADGPCEVVDLVGEGADAIERRLLISSEIQARIDDAGGGTLILDHVGAIRPEVWRTFLQVLGDRSGPIPRTIMIVNVRGGAGLPDELDGRSITVPALRERREDIPVLVHTLAAAGAPGAGGPAVTREALEALINAPWPGNVAELRVELDRALAAAGERGIVGVEQLSDGVRRVGSRAGSSPPTAAQLDGLTLAEARDVFETWMIRRVIDAADGNQTIAAERLGMSRAGLFKKIRKLGIDPS